eukprot:m.266192 g.266192  ORF g.266192 m.266192 type:complete len:409 (-) comp17627_c0_seq5:6388-7614(-)
MQRLLHCTNRTSQELLRLHVRSTSCKRFAAATAGQRGEDTKPPPGLNFYDQKIVRPWTEIATTDNIGMKFLFDSGLGRISPVDSAQILARNLPARLLFCIQQFLQLPFILGCNPHFKRVNRAYLDAYKEAASFTAITNDHQEQEYVELLKSFVDDHMDVISNLAQGVRDCLQHHSNSAHYLDSHMDAVVRARISIRLLVEHQIALHNKRKNHAGVVHLKFNPVKVARKCIRDSQALCTRKYGIAPEVEINGHVDAEACYVVAHLEYILMELLKNSFRATVEHHPDQMELPPVRLTLSKTEDQLAIRISDEGGGFEPSIGTLMWSWSYTTVDNEAVDDGLGALAQQHDVILAGLGVGLPMTQCYASYFGGNIEVRSMYGLGSDAFVTLPMLHEQHPHMVWSPDDQVSRQ